MHIFLPDKNNHVKLEVNKKKGVEFQTLSGIIWHSLTTMRRPTDAQIRLALYSFFEYISTDDWISFIDGLSLDDHWKTHQQYIAEMDVGFKAAFKAAHSSAEEKLKIQKEDTCRPLYLLLGYLVRWCER